MRINWLHETKLFNKTCSWIWCEAGLIECRNQFQHTCIQTNKFKHHYYPLFTCCYCHYGSFKTFCICINWRKQLIPLCMHSMYILVGPFWTIRAYRTPMSGSSEITMPMHLKVPQRHQNLSPFPPPVAFLCLYPSFFLSIFLSVPSINCSLTQVSSCFNNKWQKDKACQNILIFLYHQLPVPKYAAVKGKQQWGKSFFYQATTSPLPGLKPTQRKEKLTGYGVCVCGGGGG